jgi:hypothetical protein
MPRYRVRQRSFIGGGVVERGNVVTLPAESVGERDLWPKGHLELLPDEPAPAAERPAPNPAPATDEGEEH